MKVNPAAMSDARLMNTHTDIKAMLKREQALAADREKHGRTA